MNRGEADRAEGHGWRAHGAALRLGDLGLAAGALNILGVVAYIRGDDAAAARRFAEGLALARRHGDPFQEVGLLGDLAHVSLLTENLPVAVECAHEALAAEEARGNRFSAAWCVACLAGVAAKTGDAERAALLFGAAEAVREDLGAPWRPSVTTRYAPILAGLRAELGEGRYARARECGRALPLEEAVAEAVLGR